MSTPRKNKPFLALALAVLLAAGSFSKSQATPTPNPYQKAQNEIDGKRYRAAEQTLESAAVKSPGDQHVFMMLGRTREMLLDRDGAKEAYEDVFKIDPFTEEGRTAKNLLMDLSARIEAKKHQPLDDAKTMRRAAGDIQNQATQLGARSMQESEALAQARLRLGHLRNIDRLRRFGGEFSGGSAAFRRHYQTINDATDAMAYRTAGLTKARVAQESANNLGNLLIEHGHSTQPHLRALGTNLYVRNYRPEDDEVPPQDPLVEMRAVQDRLSNLPTELHAKANHL